LKDKIRKKNKIIQNNTKQKITIKRMMIKIEIKKLDDKRRKEKSI
jgi:hypothetical protein